MTDADRPQLAKVLAVLGATFNEPVDDLKAEGYFAALRDLPFHVIRSAAMEALKTCRFFPRPADLRDLSNADGTTAVLLSAWLHMLAEIRRVGSWREPTLSPELTAVIGKLYGSWAGAVATVGQATPFELTGLEKQFRVVYAEELNAARLLLAPKPVGQLSS